MKTYLPLLIAIMTLFIGACASESNQEDQKQSPPNIIYILADDLGYGDMSCYGQEKFATPHLDQLASAGIRFTRHYSGSTVCAPSRSVLMTGLHMGHTSVRANTGGVPLVSTGQRGVVFRELKEQAAICFHEGPDEPQHAIDRPVDLSDGRVHQLRRHVGNESLECKLLFAFLLSPFLLSDIV